MSLTLSPFMKSDSSCTSIATYSNGYSMSLISILNSVHPNDQDQVTPLRNTLIQEYCAQTPTEFLIIDQIVSTHLRILRIAGIYNHLIQEDGKIYYSNQERTNFIKELTRQLDSANKHFLLLVTHLRQLKSPPIQVKVETKQAFIAQNQQLNNNA